jgi:HPt (histidine-containing phosphotransfer) domain-containing protein
MEVNNNIGGENEMLFNTALLGELGDKKSLLIVLDFFLNNTPKDLTELASFTQNKDHLNIFKKAHRLKGSLSMLKATKIVDILAKLEYAASVNENMDIIEELVASFLGNYSILEKQLRAEMDRIKSSLA